MARRLIGTRRINGKSTDGAARGAAEACGQLYNDLSRWVGPDGCHALFTRSLTHARTSHPALAQIHLRARSDPYVEGVTEATVKYGDPITAEALEAVLAFLIELLGRLIGEDMAMKLIQRSLPDSQQGSDGSGDMKEQA